MTAKTFPLGDVLSVTTGYLIGPGHVGGVYGILDHMEGWPHFTHQLGAASERVMPVIFGQHPALDQDGLAPPDDWFDGFDAETSVPRAAEWVTIVQERFGLPVDVELTAVPTESRDFTTEGDL